MANSYPESQIGLDKSVELLLEGMDPANTYQPAPLSETLAGTGGGTDPRVSSITDEVKVGGTTVYYAIQAPEGADLATIPWVEITPGYVGIWPAYKPLGHYLALEGVAAVTIRPPRTQGGHGWHPKHVRHPELLLAQVSGGVARHTAKQHEAHDIHLLGHSMGGPAVVGAAAYLAKRKDRGLIKTVTIAMPGGSTGETYLQTGINTNDMIRHEIMPNRELLRTQLALDGAPPSASALAREGLLYVLKNPYRTIAEGFAVTHCDIRPGLDQLDELGIDTVCIAAIADQLFRHSLVQDRLQGYVKNFVTMANPETAGHMAPQLYPQAMARLMLTSIGLALSSKNAAA